MTDIETVWLQRWVTSLCDPLVDTDARVEIDSHMVTLVAQAPHWFCAWMSGFVSDMVRSLNPEDPWRNLREQAGFTYRPDGERFQGYEMMTDVAVANTEDLRSDFGLAALAKDIHPDAAILLASAAGGQATLLKRLESTLFENPIRDRESAADFFAVCGQAVRWAMRRRREYAGMDDYWPHFISIAWEQRANKIESMQPWDQARAARELENGKIMPGEYKLRTEPMGYDTH
ncbi:MAG: hypothetical protein HIU81_13850 [Acidobacteria bacterium]|nr:hypothetical protein [Acidobacteriota bacterium]